MFNPLAQVIIQDESGKELFKFGYESDIPLIDLSWSLEANENGSVCECSIPLYRDVLDKLLLIKPYVPEIKQPESNGATTTSMGGTVEAKNKEDHIKIIIGEARRQGITNPKQLAYILATVEHETSWTTFTESASGEAYEGRADLGNTQAGDGPRYKGRGYVQLTGRNNYAKYSKLTGKDLVGNPGLAAQSPVREFVLIHGMKTGHFTGVSLGDYTSASGSVDYYNARAVINGDKGINGSSIAELARGYENHPLIKASGVTSVAVNQIVQPQSTIPTANTPSYKLLIRAGELGVLFVEFVYLVSDVTVEIGTEKIIKVSGVTPLWAINQYKQTYTLQNLTLKQLAERTARKSGLSLEFSGKGTEFVHLENNGLTDYQLLLRECRKAGYVLSNQGTKLIIKPIREGKQYVIEAEEIISFTSSLIPGSAIPQSSGGVRGSWEMKPTKTANVQGGSITSVPTSANQPNKPKSSPESKTTGIVTLESGKQVTESQAATELARVQDNPSQMDFIPQASDLLIAPTDMVKIQGLEHYSEELTKIDYYVAGVSYAFSDGLIGTLKLYKPGIEVKAAQIFAGNPTSNVTSADSNQEGWGFPCPKPYVFSCSNGFRMRNGRMHTGLDITGAETGKADQNNVYATKSGVVSDVETGCRVGDLGCGDGYGNLVIVKHSGGYSSLYAHLSSVKVRIGQAVKKGELLGLAGNTGNSSGLHLHFEIRKDGKQIDPAPLIGARCT